MVTVSAPQLPAMFLKMKTPSLLELYELFNAQALQHIFKITRQIVMMSLKQILEIQKVPLIKSKKGDFC